jgi:hypothetical protein
MRENMAYDLGKDEYYLRKQQATDEEGDGATGKADMRKRIAGGCPLGEKCTKSKTNRRMEVSKKFMEYRERSEGNIRGEEGSSCG